MLLYLPIAIFFECMRSSVEWTAIAARSSVCRCSRLTRWTWRQSSLELK